METIERIRTEKAFEFLVDRNPLDDRTDRITQVQYVTLLATFHHTHGDEAIEGLAGFFCYAIDNMSEEEQTRAIRNVFAHDLSGAEDKLMCPRSLGYAEVWHKEFDEKYPYTESRKLNEQAKDSGKYEFNNPVKKEIAHTPGPWKAVGTAVLDRNGFGLCDASDTLVLHNWSSKKVDHWSRKPGETYREISDEEAEANARLIAAAPDLLEALKGLMKQVERDCSISSDPRLFDLLQKHQEAYQAINKAKSAN